MTGILFATNWMTALIALAVFLLILLVIRYVSLASMVSAVSMPIANFFTWELVRDQYHWGGDSPHWIVTVFYALGTVLVIVRHRSNIKKLRDKEETRVRFREQKAEGAST